MKCCKTSSLRECTREIWLNLIWLSPVNKMLAAKSPHILALELQCRHKSPIFTTWKSWLKPSTNLRWTKPYQTWHSTMGKYGKTTTGMPWLWNNLPLFGFVVALDKLLQRDQQFLVYKQQHPREKSPHTPEELSWELKTGNHYENRREQYGFTPIAAVQLICVPSSLCSCFVRSVVVVVFLHRRQLSSSHITHSNWINYQSLSLPSRKCTFS